MLVGAGGSYAVGATGGEATHTLTVAEMPSHTHKTNMVGITYNKGAAGIVCGGFTITDHWNTIANGGSADGYGYGTLTSGNVGSSAAHNNMPPYLAVYMWKRTA